ncbi:MAG: hypothetical protein AVDCRST_MAG69-1059 [uncultured Solirubrobacteraceae bacterium]|uniref:O-antigen ligase-related domain-containing protein n=1 Tax=uncultured Solirubrobacteraceae bacterium TaxID=1162706 RepID=A0A6J4S0L0_9ACTN|nr:MAG: hypothetical protein AVDCRST_MAG69-1059 [uncultured Solirubrobacteraceae bacterium]
MLSLQRPPALATIGPRLRVEPVWAVAAASTLVLVAGLAIAPDRPQVAIGASVATVVAALALAEPRWVLLILVAGLTLFLGQPRTAGVGLPPSTLDVLLFVVAAGVLVRCCLKRESVRLPGSLLSLFVLMAVTAHSAAEAHDPSVSANHLVVLGRDVMVAALVLVLCDDKAWIRRVAWTMGLSIGLLALLAVVHQFATPAEAFGGLAMESPGDRRSGGPMGSANRFAQALLVGAVLTGYLGVSSRGWGRALGLVAAALCVIAIVLTASRGGLVALALIGLFILLLHPARAWLPLVVLAVAAAVMIPRVADRYEERLAMAASAVVEGPTSVAANRGGDSIRNRFLYQVIALDMFKDEPLLGVGPENFPVLYKSYADRAGIATTEGARSPHSLFLESLSETGLLGFAAFGQLVLLAITGTATARRVLSGQDAALAEAVMLAILAFIAAGFFLHLSTNARYLLIPIGLALATRQWARRCARPQGPDRIGALPAA